MDLKRRFILFSFVILCWTSAASAQDDDSNGGLLGGILHGIVDFVDDLFGGEDDDEVQDAPEGGFCAALVDDNSNSNPCRFESEYAMEAFNKKNYCRDYKKVTAPTSSCPDPCPCVRPSPFRG